MSSKKEDRPSTTRGRPFVKGNPGRKPGSKNRSTLIAEELSENIRRTLLNKGLNLALNGDPRLLKFFLERILPRDRLVVFDVPKLEFADDGVTAIGGVLAAVGEGNITMSEGANLAAILEVYAKQIEIADLVNRLDAMQARLNELPAAGEVIDEE